jgi:hypothetical protein
VKVIYIEHSEEMLVRGGPPPSTLEKSCWVFLWVF